MYMHAGESGKRKRIRILWNIRLSWCIVCFYDQLENEKKMVVILSHVSVRMLSQGVCNIRLIFKSAESCATSLKKEGNSV